MKYFQMVAVNVLCTYIRKVVGIWSSVVDRKLRYFGHIMRKEDENLGEISSQE